MTLPSKILLLSVILVANSAVKADTLDFTLTGAGNTFTFSLPANPSPDSSTNGTSFTLNNIIVTEGLIGFTTNLTFSNMSQGGGLNFLIPASPPIPGTGLDLIGPQIYSGLEASPMFGPTTTTLVLGTPKGDDEYTLGITDPSVPEPASVGLLATGLFALAGTVRRKRFAN
jgi:hypothetical protein